MTAWPIPEERRAEDRTGSSYGDQDLTRHSTEARLDRTWQLPTHTWFFEHYERAATDYF